jgi:hypothetical protein|tara:strand:+ start:4541 stop:5146 length:606 start_codon:yes stop_codon:yes gene_type:complete
MKKTLLSVLFVFLTTVSFSEQKLKVLATINNESITNIDLLNEIKIIQVLNKEKNINFESENTKQIALTNIVNEILKNLEVNTLEIKANKNLIDEQYSKLINTLGENKNQVSAILREKIYQKIELDNRWNSLILQQYSWKTSVNMKEIDQKLKTIQKKDTNSEQSFNLKEQILMTEKNKKISTYSNNHLEKIKKKALIKFFP